MKKLIISILFALPFCGFSQIRTLKGLYSNGMPGANIKDTMRTLVAQPPLSITTGGASLVDTVKYSAATPSLTTLTDSATIVWDYSSATTEAKVTIAGNRTLSITNLPEGKVVYLTLVVTQDATGSRTLTLPSGTKVIGGGSGVVTLTTTANAIDILSFRWNGVLLFCTYGKNYN